MRPPLAVLGFCVALSATAAPPRSPVVVASKPFGESYVLAEMFAQLLEAHGIAVERKPGLGSTEIAFDALRTGAIDVYPEYTGTGLVAILHDQLPPETLADPRAVFGHVANASLRRFGVRWLPPLGFQNSFALAVRPEFATALRLRTLSDLARNGSKQLKAGFTPDFIERPDGLLGLVRAYGEGIRPANIKPLLPAVVEVRQFGSASGHQSATARTAAWPKRLLGGRFRSCMYDANGNQRVLGKITDADMAFEPALHQHG